MFLVLKNLLLIGQYVFGMVSRSSNLGLFLVVYVFFVLVIDTIHSLALLSRASWLEDKGLLW